MIGLEKRVVIVTGAAQGLGRSHALMLAARGARVIVNDVGTSTAGVGGDPSAPQRVVDEIRSTGADAVADAHSVSEPEGARNLVTAAIDAYGRLDAVVNNAGFLRDRTISRLTDDDIDSVLAVHLRAPLLLSREAMPHLRASGSGRFVHTTSSSGLFGNIGQANYSAAKSGLLGLSRTLSLEGAKHGVRSNVIAPVARTRMLGDLLGAESELLEPAFVSSLVVLLVSEQCPVSGEVLSVIGRRYARVLTAVTDGWVAPPGADPEDLLVNLGAILSADRWSTPEDARAELRPVLSRLH